MARKNGPWTINESHLEFQNDHLQLWEDEVTQPDGKPGRYATVRRGEGVCILPVDEEGNAYLVQQFRYALGKDSLEVVSGAIRAQEQPQDAARREASEELGLEAASWTPLGCYQPDTSIVYNPVHLFLARNLSFHEPHREGSEAMHKVRLPLEQAVQQALSGEISNLVSAFLLLKAAKMLEEDEIV